MTASLRIVLSMLVVVCFAGCATEVAGTPRLSPHDARLIAPERIQVRLVLEDVTDVTGTSPPPTTPTTQGQTGGSSSIPGTDVRPSSAPPGSVVLSDEDGHRFLLGPIKLDGAQIESALAQPNPTEAGRWEVDITMTPTGRAAFTELTSVNTGQRFAIVVAGVVVSAPRIESEIDEGQVRITGTFSKQDATDLAGSINRR